MQVRIAHTDFTTDLLQTFQKRSARSFLGPQKMSSARDFEVLQNAGTTMMVTWQAV
jgi:hypothetical protein